MPYAGRVHLLAALLLLAAPATAQSAAADARTLALAAGWKASFLCSDIFVGGMDEKSVISNELEDAQTNLQPLLAGLEAKIDRAARRVEPPLVLVVVNVAYTLLSPTVSLWGHLGGLAAGAAMAWPLTSRNARTRWITAGAATVAACVVIWVLTIPSTLPVYV